MKEEMFLQCWEIVSRMELWFLSNCSFEEMSRGDYMMLNLLTQSANDGKMMTVTMMSDSLKVSKAAISQSIKALKKKEWVKSISDTIDKRKSYIVLTDEGRKAYEKQRKVIIRNLQECFSDVDEADLKMFCDKLTKVAEQISLKI
ncbi:MAG: hypothetical protein EGR09_02045 [Clostridiales bacterium]|nr:hypothetical protein [Clostridiales bacterium]